MPLSFASIFLVLGFLSWSSVAFQLPFSPNRRAANKTQRLFMSSTAASPSELVDPSYRDTNYASNIGQYLVDLHDSKATFDFCGGMMFQLVLTDKLKQDLLAQNASESTVVVYDATKMRMHQIPNYQQTADADNVRIFHGREIRRVPDAAGGMGMVLQLSSVENDPEGWTVPELEGYDGWGHDSGRTWRQGERLEQEGFKNFREKFGPSSFALHHRFYLHLDPFNRLWLSAEDGCEGTPAVSPNSNPIANLFKGLF